MSERQEPRLTEAEWRLRQARRECAIYGHDWSIIQTGGGVPVSLHCDRMCGGAPTYATTPPAETDRAEEGL